MDRHHLGLPRCRNSRRSRFEQLEPRHLLSATNLALTNHLAVQQMPPVAVNPLDPDHVAVAYMDYSLVNTGYAGIGVAVSHDAGDTWQYSSIPLPEKFGQGAANPTARFDNVDHDPKQDGVQNRVYVSFMAATFQAGKPPLTNPNQTDGAGVAFRAYGFTANNGIFVASSGDGGLIWNPEDVETVSSRLYDGVNRVPFEIIPDLAIDTYHTITTKINGQDIQVNPMYATFSRYYPAGQY